MRGIKITTHGNEARVTEKPRYLIAGTVGLPVEFTFDEQWEGLEKLAVFQAGHQITTKEISGADMTVPWEVMERPNVWLSIGLYGITKDGSVAVPTIWANIAPIYPGANPDGDPARDPNLPVWLELKNDNEAIHKKLDELNELKGQDGETPYVGENGNWWIAEVDTGVYAGGMKGDPGKDGITPVKGEDYFTEEDIAKLKEFYIPVGEQNFGEGNTIGLKGYYFTEIDVDAKEITLSLKQDVEDTDGMVLTWEVGDVMSMVDTTIYHKNCSTIVAINGNKITVDSLPFAAITPLTSENYYLHSVVVPQKPLSGQVDLGRYSCAFGAGNKIYNRESFAIGKNNLILPSAGFAFALGKQNVVEGDTAAAIGYNNTVTGENAVAVNMSNTASGKASFAGGYSTEASGDYSEASGLRTKATGQRSSARGTDSVASGTGASASGGKTEASGENSTASGYNTKATGSNSDASGMSTKASGNSASARGYNTEASGKWSDASGEGTKATKEASSAHGVGTVASKPGQMAVGSYNEKDEEAFFVVGVGGSAKPKTGFRALEGGNDCCGGKLFRVAAGTDGTDAVNVTQMSTAIKNGSVNHAASAGSASKVPWSGVTNKPDLITRLATKSPSSSERYKCTVDYPDAMFFVVSVGAGTDGEQSVVVDWKFLRANGNTATYGLGGFTNVNDGTWEARTLTATIDSSNKTTFTASNATISFISVFG